METLGHAIIISRVHKYKFVAGAIKAGKLVAHSFGIHIVSCEYKEPNNDYSCYLHVL